MARISRICTVPESRCSYYWYSLTGNSKIILELATISLATYFSEDSDNH
jgi:hypothetical protein